jgi:hypothetical protein
MKRPAVLYATTLALALWAAGFAHDAGAAPADDAQAFVARLRQAAAQPGGAALADLAQLPFLFESRQRGRDEFVSTVVPALFTPQVRRCLQTARPRSEDGRLVLWCAPYSFYASPVAGRWKLVEFAADAE